MAQRQEMLTVSAEGFLAGSPASEALFKRAASYRSKRVHYQPGLYSSPWEKDDAAVRDISTSFKKRRTSFTDGLKERALLEEAAIMNEIYEGGGTQVLYAQPRLKGTLRERQLPEPERNPQRCGRHKLTCWGLDALVRQDASDFD